MDKKLVRAWMVAFVGRFETATQMAETAVDVLLLPEDWLDDETHWVWDVAADVFANANR